MWYQFIIKKSSAKTAPIQFTSNWFEAENLESAIAHRNEYLATHPEIDGNHCKWNEKEKIGRGGARKGTGGKREGAGRKPGSGKWGEEKTTIARIPISIASNAEKIYEAMQTIEGIINAWEWETENAKNLSITGKIPRTYDKAKELLRELKEELNLEKL